MASSKADVLATPEINLTPNEEISLDVVKKRAIRGIAALTGRTAFLQLVSFVAGVIFLPAFLTPTQYGVYVLVSAIVSFFVYFSDVGLAAALIQKKDKPTKEDLRTTFTIQQGLVVILVILIIGFSPIWQRLYGLSEQSLHLLWAIAFSFFLSSLKTIPSVLLERNLRFEKLIIPQMVETLVFNIIVVTLAWHGFGITSYTFAVLARGVSGLIVMYWLSPWMPAFDWSWESLKRLLKFGVPFQANTFLAVVKDDGITALLGLILGPAGVGLLGLAQKLAKAPLLFFMEPVRTVTFPAFSRMQHDKKQLSVAVSNSLYFVCLLTFPTLMGLVILAGPLIEVFPQYERWRPALFALSMVSFNYAWASISTPLTSMLNAIGKIKITFRLMVMWTTLTWILIPLLALRYHINGAAIGFAIVGLSSLVAIIWALKYVKISLTETVGIPLIASLGMGLAMFIAGEFLPINIFGMITLFLLGIISYVGIFYLIVGKEIIADLKSVYAAFKKN